MNPESVSILLLEDDEEDAFLFQRLLTRKNMHGLDCQITHVKVLEDALKELANRNFTLIVTDLFVPDSKGIETFNKIQAAAEFTPIVILSGSLSDEEVAIQAVSRGAQDYIPKAEINALILSRVVRYAITRHHLQEELRAQSLRDSLSGLYNRRGFLNLFEHQIEISKKIKQGFYLFYIDIDYLKQINDTYGHLDGDKAIKLAADILKNTFLTSDILGRIGGDEFAVVAINRIDGQGENIKKKLLEVLKTFNENKILPFNLSLSIGMTYFNPSLSNTLEELLSLADNDLYKTKKARQILA